MSTDRDVARSLRSWLREDRRENADRVLDAVLTAVDTTPQRSASWLARRIPLMKNTFRIALAAAAVVVIAFIGYQYLGNANTGGPGVSASAEPSTSAEPSASAAPEPSTPADGSLPVASSFAWLDGQVPVTVTIPASGWFGDPGFFALQKAEGELAVLAFTDREAWLVPGDGCNWESTLPDTPSATIDDFVAAMSAQAGRDASAPVDIEVDGHAGKSITLHVPSDLAFTGDDPDCDYQTFCQWIDPVLTGRPVDNCARTAHAPDEVNELWIVEVGDKLVVINAAYLEGSTDEHVEEMRTIVASITFE